MISFFIRLVIFPNVRMACFIFSFLVYVYYYSFFLFFCLIISFCFSYLSHCRSAGLVRLQCSRGQKPTTGKQADSGPSWNWPIRLDNKINRSQEEKLSYYDIKNWFLWCCCGTHHYICTGKHFSNFFLKAFCAAIFSTFTKTN